MEIILLMTLLADLRKLYPLYTAKPDFICTVWEDNQSCIAMTEAHKFTSRTKNIALKYDHLRSHVDSGKIKIIYKPSKEQIVEILTKLVNDPQFYVVRYLLMGR